MATESVAGSPSSEGERLDSTAIFNSEFRYLWNTLRRLGVHERDVEDVIHEVFLRVHGQLYLFDTSRPLRAWLFGIALGVVANYRRLARHRVDLVGGLQDLADVGSSTEQDPERREQARSVHVALQKLSLDQRAVLLMHEIDGHSMPEVALTLGLNLNTAYSRLRLAREAFRAAYSRLVGASQVGAATQGVTG